jgi:hypothetical protein
MCEDSEKSDSVDEETSYLCNKLFQDSVSFTYAASIESLTFDSVL